MIHLRTILSTSDQNLGPQVNKNNALFSFYEETAEFKQPPCPCMNSGHYVPILKMCAGPMDSQGQ